MASQQNSKEGAPNEKQVNSRETMAVLTSGARQKVDTAMAGASALGQQMLHPFDKNARGQAQEAAEAKKQEAVEKRDSIRAVAQSQATQGRLAARGVQPESGGGQLGEHFPSAQTAGQHGVNAPVEGLDRPNPSSDKEHTTLGEMLGREAPDENPHIKHIDGNKVGEPHLDRNVEFHESNDGAPVPPNAGNLSTNTNRDNAGSDERNSQMEKA